MTMLVARQTCLMVGREIARLPALVNHGRATQTVLTDDQSEIIVERARGLQLDPRCRIIRLVKVL